jgi:hypothetical protein
MALRLRPISGAGLRAVRVRSMRRIATPAASHAAGCGSMMPSERNPPNRFVASGIFASQPQQHIAMAGQGRTPADQIAPVQLVQRCHQLRLGSQPPLVRGNGNLVLGRIALASRTKWVCPFARRQPIPGILPADVDGAGRDDRPPVAEAWQLPDVEDVGHGSAWRCGTARATAQARTVRAARGRLGRGDRDREPEAAPTAALLHHAGDRLPVGGVDGPRLGLRPHHSWPPPLDPIRSSLGSEAPT